MPPRWGFRGRRDDAAAGQAPHRLLPGLCGAGEAGSGAEDTDKVRNAANVQRSALKEVFFIFVVLFNFADTPTSYSATSSQCTERGATGSEQNNKKMRACGKSETVQLFYFLGSWKVWCCPRWQDRLRKSRRRGCRFERNNRMKRPGKMFFFLPEVIFLFARNK